MLLATLIADLATLLSSLLLVAVAFLLLLLVLPVRSARMVSIVRLGVQTLAIGTLLIDALYLHLL